MSKMLSLIAGALLLIGFTAPANATTEDITRALVAEIQQGAKIQATAQGINWKVGDTTSYSIDMGFIKGKMTWFVREDTGAEYWTQQDVNLGFMGEQKIETLIDKADGSVKKMLINGQEQTPPEAGNQEVLEMTEANVTVAAGTFDCIYVKIKDNGSGQVSEAWLNPRDIPVSGMLKSIQPSQLGKVTMELTSFKFAQ